MPTLLEVRKQYPQYEDMSDEQLADGLYKKFYSDMDRNEFNSKLGISQQERSFEEIKANPPSLGQTELRAAPEKTWLNSPREKLAELIVGDSHVNSDDSQISKSRLARDLLGTDTVNKKGAALANFTPARIPLFAAEAVQSTKEGNYGQAALEGVAAVPIPGLDKAVEVGVKGINKLLSKSPKVAPKVNLALAPEIENLKILRDQGYKAAEDAGLVFNGKGVAQIAAKFENDLTKRAATPQRQPLAFDVLSQIQKIQNKIQTKEVDGISLQGIDALRKAAGDVAGSGSKAERALGVRLKNHIDDYLDAIDEGDVILGDVSGIKGLRQGQEYSKRIFKTEQIDTALEKAHRRASSTGTGGNANNATRQNFRSILDSDKRIRGWTPEEKAALDKVVTGTGSSNAARFISKAAPTGIVSTSLATGLGAMLGGPLGAAVVPATGMLAKLIADKGTERAVQELSALVRSGGKSLPKEVRKIRNIARAHIRKPTPSTLRNLQKSTIAIYNMAKGSNPSLTVDQFLRSLQGPSAAAADEKNK